MPRSWHGWSIPPGVYFRDVDDRLLRRDQIREGDRLESGRFEEPGRLSGIQDDGRHPGPLQPESDPASVESEAHKQVFAKVLEILKKEGLLKGKKIGVDASNIEANAAMRSIRRKIDGKRYEAYLKALAKQLVLKSRLKEDLSRFDPGVRQLVRTRTGRARPIRKPSATKMKDGRTHLAYKPEHAMDLETGAMVSAVIHPADHGDTDTMWETLAEASENLSTVEDATEDGEKILQEYVADKGYHTAQVLVDLEEVGIRSYISEPDRGRRKWKGKKKEQKSRRREQEPDEQRHNQGNPSRKRAEILERSFAHLLDSGGMRRALLRGQENIWEALPDSCLCLQPLPGHATAVPCGHAEGPGGPDKALFAPSIRSFLLRQTDNAICSDRNALAAAKTLYKSSILLSYVKCFRSPLHFFNGLLGRNLSP